MAGRQRPRFVGVWLSDAGVAELDKLAGEAGVSRSEMVRMLLREALETRQKKAERQARGWA